MWGEMIMAAPGSTGAPSTWAPFAVSIAAAVIALLALWRTHLRPFRMAAITGDLSVAIYPIGSEDSKWYIVSVETDVTIANAGARPGSVVGLRVSLRFLDVESRRQRCYLDARFVVTQDDQGAREQGRFAWLDACTRRWSPVLLLPKEARTEAVLFERRIEHPISGRLRFQLQAHVRPGRRWRKIASWELDLDREIFSFLVSRRKGGGISVPPRRAPQWERETKPADLFQQAGFPEDELPPPPFQGSSKLDYPGESTEPG
jgi:hypothetical protein